MKKIGLKQVAERAGVSIATVSYVFSGNGRVSTETKSTVLRAADELGFIPDAAASRLRSGQSRLIGVILNNLANPFFGLLIAELEAAAYREGYLTLVATAQNDPDRQLRQIESMVSQGVAAIILSPVHQTPPEALHAPLVRDIPVVSCVRAVPGGLCGFVGVDDSRSGALAGEAMIAAGHRSAVFIGGYPDTSTFEGRRLGVRQAFAKAGLGADACRFLPGPLSSEFGAEAFASLGEGDKRNAAIICFNDTVAAGVYEAARENGLCVGRDLSVIGFDNVPIARALFPALSTVDIFPARIGALSADMAIAMIETSGKVPSETRLEPAFIARGSVRSGA